MGDVGEVGEAGLEDPGDVLAEIEPVDALLELEELPERTCA